MPSDDEDYMSDLFLSKCVESTNDIRPGLLHSHANKRKHNLDKKKRDEDEKYRKKMRPIQDIQEERRKEGLQTPLDSSNKGFSLMQKMGYKPGMSLGKQGTGIVEPVSVTPKANRIGLGWQELLAEKRRKYEARKKQKKVEMDPAEYRALMSNQHNQKLVEGDLRRCRKVCNELDFKEGILSPPEYWFWPKRTWEDADEGEDEEEEEEEEEAEAEGEAEGESTTSNYNEEHLPPGSSEKFHDDFEPEPSEQLQIIASYLRSTYLYCLWCCIKYEDSEDLEKNCPGLTRSDHDD